MQLTKFPIQIVNLNKLQGLFISRNKLTYLLHSIKNLKNLLFLDVSYNDLLYLPASILKMRLCRTEISGNLFWNSQICDVNNLKMSSLIELAAKIIIDRRFVASFYFCCLYTLSLKKRDVSGQIIILILFIE